MQIHCKDDPIDLEPVSGSAAAFFIPKLLKAGVSFPFFNLVLSNFWSFLVS